MPQRPAAGARRARPPRPGAPALDDRPRPAAAPPGGNSRSGNGCPVPRPGGPGRPAPVRPGQSAAHRSGALDPPELLPDPPAYSRTSRPVSADSYSAASIRATVRLCSAGTGDGLPCSTASAHAASSFL